MQEPDVNSIRWIRAQAVLGAGEQQGRQWVARVHMLAHYIHEGSACFLSLADADAPPPCPNGSACWFFGSR